MRALAEAKLRCPQDVALIGFDDIPAASQTSPTLTTVMQDMKGAGELLVDALLRRIGGAGADRTMLPAQLIKRQSTAVSRGERSSPLGAGDPATHGAGEREGFPASAQSRDPAQSPPT